MYTADHGASNCQRSAALTHLAPVAMGDGEPGNAGDDQDAARGMPPRTLPSWLPREPLRRCVPASCTRGIRMSGRGLG